MNHWEVKVEQNSSCSLLSGTVLVHCPGLSLLTSMPHGPLQPTMISKQ
jgi:hypothetical protein